MIMLHRVIWESVRGPILDPKLEVNHIDGDKLNNSIKNLELLTPIQNTWHAARIGLTNSRLPQAGDSESVPRPGVHRPRARLTAEQVIEIRALLAQQVSQKTVAEMYGVTPECISRLWRGESWARVPRSAVIHDS